jgi:hypothetical protein
MSALVSSACSPAWPALRDLGAERFEHRREHARHRACADQADRAARELAEAVLQCRRACPSARTAYRAIELAQPAQAGEHQKQRHLGYRAAVGSRQVAHGDAARAAGLHRDRVDAAADLLHQPQARGALELRRGHRFEHMPENLRFGQQAIVALVFAFRAAADFDALAGKALDLRDQRRARVKPK